MIKTTQHTPVPWEFGFKSSFKPKSSICIWAKTIHGTNVTVAKVGTNFEVNEESQNANAALIVKAVNCHAVLVEALKQAEEINNAFHAMKPNVRKDFSLMNQAASAMKVIRAALDQAEGSE